MTNLPIDPAGHMVLIKPDKLVDIEDRELEKFESLKKTGFEMSPKAGVAKKREEGGIHVGTLVRLGPQAWIGHALSIINARDELIACGWDEDIIRRACRQWAAAGDRVYFAKYGGYEIEHDGETYRVMNDEDVTAIIRSEVAA